MSYKGNNLNTLRDFLVCAIAQLKKKREAAVGSLPSLSVTIIFTVWRLYAQLAQRFFPTAKQATHLKRAIFRTFRVAKIGAESYSAAATLDFFLFLCSRLS
jgi:long-subunit acyl-CoA synthetase (AMP-forming)